MRKHPRGGKCVLHQGRAAGHHTAHFQLTLSPQGLPNATVVTAGMSWMPEEEAWGHVHIREGEKETHRDRNLKAHIKVSNKYSCFA